MPPRHEPDVLRYPIAPAQGHGWGVSPEIAVLPSGDLVVAGTAVNGLDLGAGAMKGFTAYVAVLSPTGQLRWIRSAQTQWSNLATNDSGRVLLVTDDRGAAALGAPSPDAAPGVSRLVALDARGVLLWSRTCDAMLVHDVAVGKDGSILLSGSAQGALDLGGGPVPQSGSGVMDAVVARLDADGRHRWTRRFPTNGGPIPLSGAVFDDGSVVVATANFEASEGIEFASPNGRSGVVPHAGALAKLGPAGDLLWTRVLSPSGAVGISHLASDGEDILATGVAVGGATFAGELLHGGPQGSMLVARLDGTGNPRWVRILESASRFDAAGGKWIGPAKGGDTIVGGYSVGLALGASASPPPRDKEEKDGFAVVRLDPAGHPKSARVLTARVMYAAMGGGDAVFASAVFDGTFDITDARRSPERENAARTVRTQGPEVLVIRTVP